jgi:pyruvate ferredoxin oxidoreductase alpha subunit
MGSLAGTIKENIKDYQEVGLLKITTFRPFPSEEIIKAAGMCENISIIEKAVSPGSGGPLYSEIRAAISQTGKRNIKNYIVGLGGKDISQKMIQKIIKDSRNKGKQITFIG